MRAFLKRLVIWLALSMPAGMGLGGLVSGFLIEDSALDRFTSVANGVLAGFWLALIAAVVTAAVTAATRVRLREAGGSEAVTGFIISYGFIAIGLGLLTLS